MGPHFYIKRKILYYKFKLTKITPIKTKIADNIRNLVNFSFKKIHDNKIIKITED